MNTRNARNALPAHTRGSGNIFADLGLPDAEEHELKATLVVQLKRLMSGRDMTAVEAAGIVGMKEPDLSRLLRGHFEFVSVYRLMHMLTSFGEDIEIRLKPHSGRGKRGRVTFILADASAAQPRRGKQ